MTTQQQVNVRDRVRRSRTVLRRAAREAERIDKTLKRSEKVSTEALPVLKKAGLLR